MSLHYLVKRSAPHSGGVFSASRCRLCHCIHTCRFARRCRSQNRFMQVEVIVSDYVQARTEWRGPSQHHLALDESNQLVFVDRLGCWVSPHPTRHCQTQFVHVLPCSFDQHVKKVQDLFALLYFVTIHSCSVYVQNYFYLWRNIAIFSELLAFSVFTARRDARAVYAVVMCLSVCPSVHLS